jgi:ribosome recycling factor
MKLLIMLCCILSSPTYAQNNINDIKISKDEIVQSLEMLKKNGSISEEDYQKAKKELGTMNDKQVDSLTMKAKETIKKNPTGINGSGHEKKANEADLEKLNKEFDNFSK